MVDYNNIPSPSNVQLLALARSEYGKALQAFSLSKGDRRIERQRINDLREQIEYLQGLVVADNNPGDGGIILIDLK